MPKMRVYELDYMRAVAMLGVLGIHTGAFALGNPEVNVHFFLLFDILTRFSVPMFFFISAFGLFLNQDLQKPFNYAEFVKRRLYVVFVPYIMWSLLYMYHQYVLDGNTAIFTFPVIGEALLLGLGSYHLYFMVILLWFYLLMPLWRLWLPIIVRRPFIWLALLFILQMLFNYYSVSLPTANTGYPWLDTAIKYRLNYWVLHYLFIFLCGAVCASFYPAFAGLLTSYGRIITFAGVTGVAGMLAYYYYLIYTLRYTCETVSYILHQLHPLGLFYTLAMTLMLFSLFSRYAGCRHNHILLSSLRSLGANSYVIYLVHPLVMYYHGQWISAGQYERTVPVNLGFFATAVLCSYMISRIIYYGQQFFPPLRLLTGSPWLSHRRVIPGQIKTGL